MHEATVAGALRLYRAALSRCWFPALLLALCWAATTALLERRFPATVDPWAWSAQAQSLLWSWFLWRLVLVAGVVSLLCYGALVAVIHGVAVHDAAPADAGIGTALRALPGALIAAILYLVATSAATTAFIIPGIFLCGMWQLWLVALVIERTGPVAALQRSWQLMRGAWWRITTLIAIVTIIACLPPLIVGGILGSVLTLSGAAPEHTTMVMSVAGVIMNVLLAPLVPAALVAAYLDRLRARAVSG
jgi:hypothetical protein